jgi:hypothetical protein
LQVKRIAGKGREQLEIILNNKKLSGKVGKVGWFQGAKYPNGTPVALIAAIQEKGYEPKNIPARPFMRPTIDQYQVTWKKIAFNGSLKILKNEYTIENVLDLIGQKAVGQIRKTIANIYTPALKATTIANRLRKYSDKTLIGNLYKPLIDTKHMYNTLINIVEDG